MTTAFLPRLVVTVGALFLLSSCMFCPPCPTCPTSTTGLSEPSTTTSGHAFRPPRVNGDMYLDYCYHFADQCGQQAADEFCKTKGYHSAKSNFTWTYKNETWILGDQKACTNPPDSCGGFDFIECQ